MVGTVAGCCSSTTPWLQEVKLTETDVVWIRQGKEGEWHQGLGSILAEIYDWVKILYDLLDVDVLCKIACSLDWQWSDSAMKS